MGTFSNNDALLGSNRDGENGDHLFYGGTNSDEGIDEEIVGDECQDEFVPLKSKTWSFSQSRRHVATDATSMPINSDVSVSRRVEETSLLPTKKEHPVTVKRGEHYLFCLIYAIVNVIIAVPGLFGYAAVIFNHPIYNSHMNVLSKRKCV